MIKRTICSHLVIKLQNAPKRIKTTLIWYKKWSKLELKTQFQQEKASR
jgi:hypothetical protein